jgi:hypothetical protein
LHPTRRFASRLNRRKEQTDQNPNDGDNDEKFDQRKTASFIRKTLHKNTPQKNLKNKVKEKTLSSTRSNFKLFKRPISPPTSSVKINAIVKTRAFQFYLLKTR